MAAMMRSMMSRTARAVALSGVVAPRVAVRAMFSTTSEEIGNIVEVLDREIELEKQTTPDAVLADVQARFADFSVTANPGFARLYLTKVLDNGDDVQVEVDVQNAVPLEEEVDEDDELVAEQDDEEPMAIDGYPMTIAIGQPEGGKQLKFQCLAAHELIIDSIRMADPNPDADTDDLYQGPSFDDLDLSVQQAFYNYLEDVAGIDDEFSDNIREFCEAKEQSEYCTWLGEVRAFLDDQSK